MRKKQFSLSAGLLPVLLTMLLAMSACSSKTVSVNFKVNSEPEGAHILYKAVGEDLPYGGEWIYLGNTPYRGVHQFPEELFDKTDKITMRVMQNGYLDQVREWEGKAFEAEAEEKGVIFWTPEMVPSTHK